MKPVLVLIFLITFSTLAAYMAVAGISFLEHESLLKEAKQKAILEMPKIDGPVEFEGVKYKNYDVIIEHVTARNYFYFFSWVRFLPNFAILFLTAGSFGVLGGASAITRSYIINNKTDVEVKNLLELSLSFFMGIAILGVAYIIPSVLVEGDSSLKMTSVMFLCFFAGLFYEKTFSWISGIFDGVTKNINKSRPE